jgi:hypothetical protein
MAVARIRNEAKTRENSVAPPWGDIDCTGVHIWVALEPSALSIAALSIGLPLMRMRAFCRQRSSSFEFETLKGFVLRIAHNRSA